MSKDLPAPNVGSVVRGRVVRFLKGAALLKIGPRQMGLLPATRISWQNHRPEVAEVLKIGDEFDVVISRVQRSRNARLYISLTRLPVVENPWAEAARAHPVGSRSPAKVVSFRSFGAIVELPTGFHALVHNSEISWTERKAVAEEHLRLDDQIEVVILLVEPEKRRIHASYRQTLENPWQTFAERYPPGTVTRGRVVSVRQYGVFVMLPDGCTGLLHVSVFPPGRPAIELGESVEVVVVSYDPEKQRIAFGWPAGETSGRLGGGEEAGGGEG